MWPKAKDKKKKESDSEACSNAVEDLDVRDWVTPGMLRVYFICTISLALQVNLKGI